MAIPTTANPHAARQAQHTAVSSSPCEPSSGRRGSPFADKGGRVAPEATSSDGLPATVPAADDDPYGPMSQVVDARRVQLKGSWRLMNGDRKAIHDWINYLVDA